MGAVGPEKGKRQPFYQRAMDLAKWLLRVDTAGAYDPYRYSTPGVIYGAPTIPEGDVLEAPEAPTLPGPTRAYPMECWTVADPPLLPHSGARVVTTSHQLEPANDLLAARLAPSGGSPAFLADDPYNDAPLGLEVQPTGAMVNTYTGEIAETLENIPPPPDYTRGDADVDRELRQAQRRLDTAMGGVSRFTRRNKTEIEMPPPEADEGRVCEQASSLINRDTEIEVQERMARTHFGNFNDLAPGDPEHTRYPISRVVYQATLPVTQPLDYDHLPINSNVAGRWLRLPD